jgi:type VI protein secretion system component VasF
MNLAKTRSKRRNADKKEMPVWMLLVIVAITVAVLYGIADFISRHNPYVQLLSATAKR